LSPTITSGDIAAEINENSGAGQVVYTASSNDSHDVLQQGAISQKFIDNGDNTFTVQFFVDASMASDFDQGVQGIGFQIGYMSEGGELSFQSAEHTSNALFAVDNIVNNEVHFQAVYAKNEAYATADKTYYDASGDTPILEATFSVSDASQVNLISISEVSLKHSAATNASEYTVTAESSYAIEADNDVIYSLAEGSDAALSIDADTGEVSLNTDPDAETQTQYSFTVVATDGAGNASGQSVTLDVADVDDTAATITSGDTANAIDENSGAEQVIYTATADDSADVSDGVTFSLADGSDAALSIDAATGAVTLNADPDAEAQSQYNFTVVATDAAGNVSDQSVTLDINDLDDTVATITSGDAAASIDENSGAGQVVYTATADDSADVSDGVTFSLADGSDAALSIDAATGAVTLSADPDADTQSQYSFAVVATDAAGNESAAQSVTLDINNLDDTAATITSGDVADAIDENSGSGQVVYTATADDSADVSDGVTFSLAAGSDTALSIDATTGAVTLNENPDADTQDQYSFTVVATDGEANASNQSVTLDINNLDEAPPEFDSANAIASIDENSGSNQLIYTASVNDSADVSGGVVFSLTENSDSGLTIDSETGEVRLVKNPYAHEQDQYAFTVVATDTAGNSTEKSLSFGVNDFTEVSVTYYSNNVQINDYDMNDGVMSKSAADISSNTVNYMDVIAALRLSVGLDRDTENSHIREEAADVVGGDDRVTTADAIALLYHSVGLDYHDSMGNKVDITPEWNFAQVSDPSDPNSSHYVGYITGDVDGSWMPSVDADAPSPVIMMSESSAAGDLVFTFSPNSQAVESASANLDIDEVTGQITLKDSAKNMGNIDNDTWFMLDVDSRDNQQPKKFSVEFANQDDTAPEFISSDAVEIFESEDAGQVVYVARANDNVDGDISAGLSYSLAGDADASLSIDAETGSVTLSSAAVANTATSFTVIATDAAGNSSYQLVSLTVNEIPDSEAPEFVSGTVADAIDENSDAGQVIYTAQASDDNAVTYTLGEGSDSALAIDATTGEVTLNATPDAETQSQYSFAVEATDAAGNSSAQTVTLDINDLDEIAPTFTSGDSASKIDENSGAGTVIYTATADDSLDVSEGLSFELATNSDPALSINPETGEVTLASNTDFESQSTYNFTVLLSDYANATVTQSVTLEINDLDEVAATITSGDTAVAIDENSDAGQVIYTVTADDSADISDGVTFSLATDSDAALSIDAATGAVTLNAIPDADTQAQYSFTVVATDAAGNVSDQSVTLDINDLDDAAATITSGNSADAIDENSGSGQVIYTVTADDSADDVEAEPMTFEPGAGSDAALSIDSATGAVTLNADPDHETQSQYSFTVVAIDAAGNESSAQTVTLDINDLDDTAPSIESGDTASTIDENSGAGQVVYTATAYDNADVSDGFTFSLAAGSDAALSIDANTGAVTLSTDPDADVQDEYSFTVVATDAAGNVSESQSVTLDINDLDDTAATITSGDTADAIDENSGSGQVIYTATADDSADVSDGVSFSLVDDLDGALSIDAATGAVTLNADPDAETQDQYSFTVVATDAAGNASTEQSVTLDINDLDEVAATITSGDSADAIDENSGSGLVVYTATADDSADVSDGVTFSLAAGSDAALSIDSATGAVTLNADPDADTQAEYSFTVVATDAAGNESAGQSVTFDITDLDDTAATITSGDTAVAINENSGSGQVVYTATADDSADVTDGVTFSLAAGSDAELSIDADSGAVTLNADPDAETQAQYSFTVVATDAAGNATDQSVTLDINDLDDASATITSGDTADAIDENSGAGQVIYTVTADDSADDVQAEPMTFSLAAGSDAALSIDSATGAVTLNADPDADTQAEYSFTVVATDAAGNESAAQTGNIRYQ
jgi:hypothetical protein